MSAIKSCICWLMVATLAVMNLGCGVMFGGSRQNVSLHSNPDGAKVTAVPTSMTYTTPATVSLERKEAYVLNFEKEGYESKKAEMQKSLRGGILALDILLIPAFGLGIVGIIVDAVTGSWYKLSPEQVDITLAKKSASIEGPDQIHISLVLEKGPEGQPQLYATAPAPVRITVESKE